MKIIGVIPARYDSKRFPGKPLADVCGKPMLKRVYDNAKSSRMLDKVVVATDSEVIKDVCNQYYMEVIMTSEIHETLTSRIYEVSTVIDADYYIFFGGGETNH